MHQLSLVVSFRYDLLYWCVFSYRLVSRSRLPPINLAVRRREKGRTLASGIWCQPPSRPMGRIWPKSIVTSWRHLSCINVRHYVKAQKSMIFIFLYKSLQKQGQFSCFSKTFLGTSLKLNIRTYIIHIFIASTKEIFAPHWCWRVCSRNFRGVVRCIAH